MYQASDCAALGLGFHPLAAGRFQGRGDKRDWRLLPDTFVISMAERGRSLERFAWGTLQLRAGDLIVLWPGRWHEISEDGDHPLCSLWLNLGGARAEALATAFAATERAPVVRPSDVPAALRLFRALVAEVNVPAALPPARFCRNLFALADLCGGAGWRGRPQRAGSLAARAEAAWHQEQYEALTASGLAARLGVHPNTLLAAARAERGTTTARLVHGWKIERARRLLDPAAGGPVLKLAGVAAACGFSSVSHFIRSFRTATGRNPGDYRRG